MLSERKPTFKQIQAVHEWNTATSTEIEFFTGTKELTAEMSFQWKGTTMQVDVAKLWSVYHALPKNKVVRCLLGFAEKDTELVAFPHG